MVNESKSFEEEDRKNREEIELRNLADSAVFNAEKMIKDSGESMEPADREKIQAGIESVRSALQSDNSDEIKKQMEVLTEAVYAVTTKIYQKVQAERQAAEGAGGAKGEKGKDDTVVDADYTMKDE
jgi:molecular chaperone DnaK